MAKLTLTSFVTLDGVMQAPGGPNEDSSGNFQHGGWLVPQFDSDMGLIMLDIFSRASAFLLGRGTYDIFSAHWPGISDPSDLVAAKLNSSPKFVASNTQNSFDWAHTSHVVDVTRDIEAIKSQFEGELQVHGSCGLAQTLIKHNLIEEYRIFIVPDSNLLVKISAGSWMTPALCCNIQALLEGCEASRLRFISVEHVLDIAHREAIIGIRSQRPRQGGLACRKMGRLQFAGYASSKNIKNWVRVIGTTPSALWLAEQSPKGIDMEVTSPRNALDLACNGIARALLPTFIGDRQAGLKRVTSPVSELTHDQWLVTHQEERFRHEVRHVIDRIYELLESLNRK